MATVTKKNAGKLQQFGGVPYGNLTGLHFTFETNASGVYVDSNQTTAVAVDDVVRVGVIPAGFQIWDYLANISDAFTGLSTFKIGFAYVDGVDVTAVPQDDDYFCAATTAASQAVLKKTNVAVRPVTLPKDAYLIITNAGADQAAAGQLDILVIGVAKGTP